MRVLIPFPPKGLGTMVTQRKPWPIADMIRMYDSGKSLEALAEVLCSEEWQQYWTQHTGANYYPSQKVVNKVLKKHHVLRGRGAPGERNGSWKGGVLGCGWDMLKGETPLDTLRRMERERRFT